MTALGYLDLGDGTRVEVGVDPVVIGRDEDAGIVTTAVSVSRRHAEICTRGHGHLVTDLNSTNGTFVNGSRIVEPTPLQHGDEIVLGGAFSLRYIDPKATPMVPAIGRLFGTWIDPESGAVWVDAIEIDLSARQRVLIETLYEREGEIVARSNILDAVWPEAAAEGVSAEAVDALVKRTRSRLREAGVTADYLETIRGIGFRLNSRDSGVSP